MSTDLVKEAIKQNPGAWWETYGRIADKDNNIVTPQLNYLQDRIESVRIEFVRRQLPIRIIGLKPRQKGLTTYSTALCYHTMRRKRTSACVIGGQYSQTAKAWEMMKLYLAQDTFEWKNHGTINEKKGTFSNGSTLEPETAGDYDAGRSGTIQFLIATEVARWAQEGVADAKKVLAGLLKCVPLRPDTVVFLESTAKGASGDFYTRWLAAMDIDDFLAGAELQPGQYVRVFAPWYEFSDSAVRLTDAQKKLIEESLDGEKWYDGEKELIATYGNSDLGFQRLGTSVTDFDVWEQLAWRRQAIAEECSKDIDEFNEDYPESWEKAFLNSGRLRFNRHGLTAMKKRAEMKAIEYIILEAQRTENQYVPRAVSKEEAKYWFWERPQPGRRYSISVDLMTGATQVGSKNPDCHSPLVIRDGYFDNTGRWVRPAVVARIAPDCRWDIDVLDEAIWPLACYFGGMSPCMIAPEVNMDRGLIELLKKRPGANIYVRVVFNQREQKEQNAFGWMTTKETREMIVEMLAKAIREWEKPGEGIDIWCPVILKQCENFVVKENGRSEASAGNHDDDVLSTCIGLATKGGGTVYVQPVLFRPLPRDIAMAEARGRPGVGRSQYS